MPYAIRDADAETDATPISTWMNLPHLVRTWEYAWSPDRWRRHLRAQAAGTYSRAFIGNYDGAAVAYLEVYRAARDVVAQYYPAAPHDLGVHAAIGDPAFLRKGVASALLPGVVDSLFAREADCTTIVFDPDHRNAAARAVCEGVGATLLGEYDMSHRRMALYVIERPG